MIQPIKKRVLLKPIEVQKTHENSSIILPEIAWEKQAEGTVIGIGEGIDETLGLKINDRVVFNRGYGTDIEHEGEKLLLMAEHDLLAVLEG